MTISKYIRDKNGLDSTLSEIFSYWLMKQNLIHSVCNSEKFKIKGSSNTVLV